MTADRIALPPAPHRTRRRTRVAALVAGAALTALALTGCIKVDADVTVNPDATGTGTFALELQKEAAQFLGISDLATFESQLSGGDLSQGGIGDFDTCESSESDTGFVYTCTFSDLAFTDPEGGPWTITKDGELLTFRMQSNAATDPAATGDTSGSDLLGDASMGSITVNVTFPGPITSVTGAGASQTSDTTATVTGSLTEDIDATITAQSSSGGFGIATLLVVLLTFAVLALIVVVAVVLITRRRKDGPTDGASEDATEATGAAAAAGAAETVAPTEVVETVDVTETVDATEDMAPTEVVETVEVTEVADATEEAPEPGEEPRG